MKNKKESDIEDEELDEKIEEDESEDEESEQEDENLENLVNTSFSDYPSKISRESIIAPSLEISNQSQRLETELRDVPTNTTEADTGQSSQYSSNSSNYMSNNYQSSSYTSSTYPNAVTSQESANPFSSEPTPFKNPGIFKNQQSSEGYPKGTEIRSYESASEQKRDKKRY